MQTLSFELIGVIAVAYICILFLIAYYGDKKSTEGFYSRHRALIYSLSLAVYCSSWTFFGAVGSAVRTGWDFTAIYLGPILVFVFGYKFIQRVIITSKQYSITSISDFLSSRYGKSRKVAVAVTVIAFIASLPYISLQLQAISMGFTTLTIPKHSSELFHSSSGILSDTGFYSSIILATFSVLFGTRHLSATEHHRGMMNAIAFESIVKMAAILLVGLYATQLLSTHFEWQQIIRQPFKLTTAGTLEGSFSITEFITKLVLSMGAILLLPRQFQVAVVEARDHRQMETARWLLPLYLLLISIIVVPIALAGLMLLHGSENADFFVLLIPQQNSQFSLALIAFIGGISAATGMVIVASVSLSTMLCNDIVMPVLIRAKIVNIKKQNDLSKIILVIRRFTIFFILLSSYGYYKLSGNQQQLANMGLLSFAATIQLAPAMIAAFYWQKANQKGVLLGLCAGFATWGYCLLLPNFVSAELLENLFANASWLHPQHLLNIQFLSPLTHGVIWSLGINVTAMIIGSLYYSPTVLDKIQASIFTHTRLRPESKTRLSELASNANVGTARVLCENIIGHSHTRQLFHSLENANRKRYKDNSALDKTVIEAIERAIASVVGASSARHIVTTHLLGSDVTAEDLFVMVDETSQAMQFNQGILQASFENISQGISVVDKNLNLVAWNSTYQKMFKFPNELLKIGTPVEKLIRFNAEHDFAGTGEINSQISRRLDHLRKGTSYSSERERNGMHIKINGNLIPGGGFVTSFTDITEQKNIEQALRDSESRIRLYTENLPLMLCYIGQDRKIHFSNKAFNTFLRTSQENAGQQGSPFFNDHGLFGEHDEYQQQVLSGEQVQYRFTSQRDGGRLATYQANYIPQTGTDGKVDGFFAFYQDITESVEASDLLRRSNEMLEQRVKERTRDLERLNRQLQTEIVNTTRLSEKLRSVTRSKTRFLAAASHDLLQPINAARLFTNSLIDQSALSTPSRLSLLKKIDSSLVNADKLLHALLDISKLDTGTLVPEINHFSLDDMFQDLHNELAPIADKKGLDLRFRLTDAIVSSDNALLRSILQNLISNAIRYTKSGGVLVGTRREGAAIRLQVSDTGTGISERNLPYIFNEFHRIDNPADNEKQGLGLGLAITRRLAEMLGHPVNVQSQLGKGTTFSITVPRYTGQVIRMTKHRTWLPVQDLTGIAAMYLENSADSLEAMEMLLQGWGCIMHSCKDYDQAMTRFNANPQEFDLVLADFRLDGGKTGLDFLEFARKYNENLCTVLVTAEQDPEIKKLASAREHIFLAKPVEPAELRGILARLAGMRRVSPNPA